MLHWAELIESFKYMGYGMAGIFGIIGILILSVRLLIWLFPAEK